MKQNKRMQGGIDVILNPHAPTSAELKAALNVTLAVSESIRELGEVPSGTLYAALIGKVNYAGYEAILQTLTNAGHSRSIRFSKTEVRFDAPSQGDDANVR